MERRFARAARLVVLGGTLVMALAMPAASMASERIIFQSNQDGNWEIYSMKPEGSEQTRLTSDPAEEGDARLSPDGSKIAFYSNRGGSFNLWVMNWDGSEQRQLTTLGGGRCFGLSWSPDGSKILFQQTPGISDMDGADIWVVNSDGTNPTQLTWTGLAESTPDCSPDGTKIAYAAFSPYDKYTSDIYVMNADGTDARLLFGEYWSDWNPRWSPDGSTIIWEHWAQIWRMNSDGSNQVMLLDGEQLGICNRAPNWSPDGMRIAFTRGSDATGQFDIWTMNGDGSNQVQVAAALGAALYPTDWGVVVPEPSSFATLACGLGGLCTMIRRRRR